MSSFLPTLCDACQRVTLTSLPSLAAAPVCAECRVPLRIVPSCTYKSADFEAFMDLSQTVAEGGVEPDEAGLLAAEVAHSLGSGSFRASFEALAQRLPGLLPFQLIAGRNLAAQERALRMLKTILEALATMRRPSAVRVLGEPGYGGAGHVA